MRRILAGIVVLAAMVLAFMPSTRYAEDRDAILLARVIYALGHEQSYEEKLMLGSVAMNRVDSGSYGDLHEVLTAQQQFPAGSRYDEESLDVAHALLAGARALPASALYYGVADGNSSRVPVARCTGYNFYAEKGLL